MTRNPALTMLNGSLAGFLIAVGFYAFFGGSTALTTVEAVEGSTGAAEPTFIANSISFNLLVLFLGALGGFILTVAASAIARMLNPEESRFPLGYVIPVGVVLGAAMAFATVGLGVTLVGDVDVDGQLTVSAMSLIVIAGIGGLVAGGATAPVVDALARPAAVGPRNEATPVSSRAFWTDAMGAVGVPMLAIIVGGFLAIALSRVLLNAESTAVAVAVFAIVGAVILGLTTLLALRPWDKSGKQTG